MVLGSNGNPSENPRYVRRILDSFFEGAPSQNWVVTWTRGNFHHARARHITLGYCRLQSAAGRGIAPYFMFTGAGVGL